MARGTRTVYPGKRNKGLSSTFQPPEKGRSVQRPKRCVKYGDKDEDNTPKIVNNFVAHIICTLKKNVLLILSNHKSHISVEIIAYPHKKDIVMLSLSHKIQPPEWTVFGPFNIYFNTAADAWIKENKEKTMTNFGH